jgi:hypothetical protein
LEISPTHVLTCSREDDNILFLVDYRAQLAARKALTHEAISKSISVISLPVPTAISSWECLAAGFGTAIGLVTSSGSSKPHVGLFQLGVK